MFSTVSAADKETFRSSLNEFVEVTGEDGTDSLADVLSGTLATQPADNRDASLSLALEPGVARQLAARMFSMMDASDIASSILDGRVGRNMLSPSSALANLPFDGVADSVRREVLEMLPVTGHGPNEAAFLGPHAGRPGERHARAGACGDRPHVQDDRSGPAR